MRESQVLMEMKQNNEWLNANFEKLQQQHEEEFVAIKSGDLVACGTRLDKLVRTLRTKRINPAFVLIRFIQKKGTFEIL